MGPVIVPARDWWVRLLCLLPIAVIGGASTHFTSTQAILWLAAVVGYTTAVAAAAESGWTKATTWWLFGPMVAVIAASMLDAPSWLHDPLLVLGFGIFAASTYPTLRLGIVCTAMGGLVAIAAGEVDAPTTTALAFVATMVVARWAWASLAVPVDSGEIGPGTARPTTQSFGFLAVTGAAAVAAGALTVAALGGGQISGTGPATGWGNGEDADLLARPDRTDRIVARLTADRGGYLRASTLDRWDGRFWTSSATAFTVDVTGSEGDDVYLVVDPQFRPSQRVDPTAEAVTFATAGASRPLTRADTYSLYLWDRRVTSYDDGTARVDPAFDAGDHVWFYSVPRPTDPSTLRGLDPRAITGDSRYARAFDDTAVTTRVAELAATITAGQPTTYDEIVAIERWFDENFTYRLDSPLPPDGTDPIEFMLFDDRTGYCEQVATAMALMLRSQGIPARLASGFVASEQGIEADEWTIRDENAHAWVEVYFPGLGWIGFDPTDGLLPADAGNGAALPAMDTTPVIGAIALATVAIAVVAAWLLRRRRRDDWVDQAARRLFAAGFADDDPPPSATLAEVRARLTPLDESDQEELDWVIDMLADATYSSREPSSDDRARCDSALEALKLTAR